MLEVPKAHLDRIGSGYTPHLVAELHTGGRFYDLPLEAWSVTTDETATSRYTCDLTLAPDVDMGLLRPYGATMRLWHRSAFPGLDTTDIPAGEYRLVTPERSLPGGEIKVAGVSQEVRLAGDAFTVPRKIVGPSTIGAILDLSREVMPRVDADVRMPEGSDRPVPTVTYDAQTSFWDAIRGGDHSLARSIAASVFMGAEGTLRVQPAPTLHDPVVWRCAEGPGGALVTLDESESDADVINAWMLTGERTDGTPPVSVLVIDDDRSSPTYARPLPSFATGDVFGRRVGFATSPLWNRTDAALRAGRVKLAASTGLSENLSLTALHHPGLEAGDTIETVAEATTKRRILASINWTDSGMSIATRVVRMVAS